MAIGEIILVYVVLAVLAVVSFAIYIFLVGTLFPERFLTVRYGNGSSTDRGLKKFKYPDGRAVLYEPHPIVRNYIKKYVLYTKDSAKYIRCNVADSVGHIIYDVAVFDNRNQLIDLITVTDRIGEQPYTSSVMLPADTSYVSLTVREINSVKATVGACLSYEDRGCLHFLIAATVATVIESVVVTLVSRELVSMIAELTRIPLKVNVPLSILACVLLGAGVILLSLHRRRKKIR